MIHIGKEKRHFKYRLFQTVKRLQTFDKILFLTTSNRWSGEKVNKKPKSTQLAYELARQIGKSNVTVIEAPPLKIYPCEGNISIAGGNNCGISKSVLKDKGKNPSGYHRCWASVNNPDDELWKISKELFKSDCVVFFGSVRWGQMNAQYQKLIERLSWIENRHTTLKEENIIEKITAGIIVIGQNWNGEQVVETQKKVLDFFGFHVDRQLCWLWQYTNDIHEESITSYQDADKVFADTFLKK